MNRIFAALILIAFAFTAFQQLTWTPPAPAEPVASHEPLPASDDPAIQQLAQEVQELRAKLPKEPVPAPVSPMNALSDTILDKAKSAVDLILGMVGAMIFFLGAMKVAEEAGALQRISRAIRPLLVRVFPDVPPDHPAMGAMVLNLSANALGLGNAATPFGLRAMEELDRLNRYKGTASNAMIRFLAINTSSITLLPTGVIVWRRSLGSHDPAAILPTTLFATMCSTATALLAVALFQRFYPRAEDVTPPDQVAELAPWEPEATGNPWPAWASWLALFALVLAIPLTLFAGDHAAPWVVPVLTAGLIGYGVAYGVPVYEAFLRGAKEGWELSVRILPYLVAILVAVGMFQTSGAMGVLTAALAPFTNAIGLPAEALPMALIRPLSGSGAMGVMVATMQDAATGPDTYTGVLVSTIMGSTETTFYVLAVYFGAVGIQRARHAVAAALCADGAGVLGSIVATQIWFWMK